MTENQVQDHVGVTAQQHSSKKTNTQKFALDQTNSSKANKSVAKEQQGVANQPQNLAAQVSTSTDPVVATLSRLTIGKPRRAERKVIKQAAMLQAQVEAHAHSAAGKVQTVTIRKTGEGDMLPVKIAPPRGWDSTAKQIKPVETVGKMGRPSEYTAEEGDAICSWISSGKSLNSYCREKHRDHVTIYRWLRERADFHARYAQAHEDRADTLVDEMVQIADDSALAPSMEAVQAAKLRVETRRWIAQKMKAKVYGDKVEVKQTGAVSIRIGMTAQPAMQVIDAEGMTVGTADTPLIKP
jgi:hypothetical protein